MAYIRHDKNNSSEDPQPGSTDASDLGGSSGWTEVSYKNFNADYEAHNYLNADRTPGTFQARNFNNDAITPGAYLRHDIDNNAFTLPLNLVVGARFQDNWLGAAFIYNDVNALSNSIKVNPSDTSGFDSYTESVAIGDSKFAVGMPHSDDPASSAGSVYLYDLDGTNELLVLGSDSNANDRFGSAVAIGNSKLVVGAPADGGSGGSAYVYNLDGTGEVKITASDAANGDNFGSAVAVANSKIYIGARGDDDGGSGSGSVYVYNLDGTGETKLTASDAVAFAYFGSTLAIGHDKLVVGASNDNPAGAPPAGGSVYVYDLDGTNEIKIRSSDVASGDDYGESVAIGSNKIVVGARNDDDNGTGSGSVYVYNLDGTGEVKITASDGDADDNFGSAVAVGGDKIYVGSRYADVGASTSTGALYIYNLDGTGEVKIPNPESDQTGQFGYSIAIG